MKDERNSNPEILPEGLYAHAKNEVLEGGLIEMRNIFDKFYENGIWGEVVVKFQNGMIVTIEEKKLKKII